MALACSYFWGKENISHLIWFFRKTTSSQNMMNRNYYAWKLYFANEWLSWTWTILDYWNIFRNYIRHYGAVMDFCFRTNKAEQNMILTCGRSGSERRQHFDAISWNFSSFDFHFIQIFEGAWPWRSIYGSTTPV